MLRFTTSNATYQMLLAYAHPPRRPLFSFLRLLTCPPLFSLSRDALALYFTEILEILRSHGHRAHHVVCLWSTFSAFLLCHFSTVLCKARASLSGTPSPHTSLRVLLWQLSWLLHHRFLLLVYFYQPTNILIFLPLKKKKTFPCIPYIYRVICQIYFNKNLKNPKNRKKI